MANSEKRVAGVLPPRLHCCHLKLCISSNNKTDFSLQKSFLKNRLNVQLSAKNPFQTYQNNSFFAYFGKMQTWYQDFNNSQYSYTLNIRYKFNTTKSKYKGTGAGESQKARM